MTYFVYLAKFNKFSFNFKTQIDYILFLEFFWIFMKQGKLRK